MDITITLDDGQTISAERACWVQYAPCGCAAGITSCYRPATEHGPATGPRLTVAQLEDFFHECGDTRAELTREREQGFHWELREWDAGHAAAQADCPHDPKWGIRPNPQREGYEWTNGSGRVQHLVPEGEKFSTRTALCGQIDRWADGRWKKDLPLCKRCEKKATA